MLFLEIRGFIIFLIVLSLTLIFNMANGALKSLQCSSLLLIVSLQFDLGVNLLGRSLMGGLLHCVNKHMNTPDLQTVETCAFREELAHADDQ